jgi:hypothetical protein
MNELHAQTHHFLLKTKEEEEDFILVLHKEKLISFKRVIKNSLIHFYFARICTQRVTECDEEE